MSDEDLEPPLSKKEIAEGRYMVNMLRAVLGVKPLYHIKYKDNIYLGNYWDDGNNHTKNHTATN